MKKLQLRLDQQQADDIIAALGMTIHFGEAGPHLLRCRSLRSWLIWRRNKVWGESAGSQDTTEPEPPTKTARDTWLAANRTP